MSAPNIGAPGRAHARRAFSLIEVLIAVLVLSLGLLGLGMVFPVVVRQQRQAQDSIQGISAVRSAASYIQGRTDLFADPVNPGNPKPNKLWEFSSYQAGQETNVGDDFHRWQTPVTDTSKDFSIRASDGRMSVTYNNATAFIPATERLFPKPFTTEAGPQFVWDFAVRKSGASTYQLAIFARRVDAGIRVPTNNSRSNYITISNVLTGIGLTGTQKSAFRVPVAVDTKGRPTLNGAAEDGTTNYSVPRTVTPTGKSLGLAANVLKLDRSAGVLMAAARQPGQKLVDNRGTVHTVLRAGDAEDTVVFEHDMSEDLLRDIRTPNKARPVNFAMTPQVPAAVMVITLQR